MNTWQRMTQELHEPSKGNMSLYAIAKRVGVFWNDKPDWRKVERWIDGRSIPDANAGPNLEDLYAEKCSSWNMETSSL